MKKALSLFLVVLMIAGALVGCTTLERTATGDYDKGAIIKMYLTSEIYNFDPQQSMTDDSMLKVFSLLYEGLTKLDNNGKWQKALMKNYKIETDKDGEFAILVYLNDTRWSDARTVQASDITYAWKRILDPDSTCEAASLLFDVKNARDIKLGDATIDDLGATAVDTYTLRIEFEHKIDLDDFFVKCSSIALVPLREDVISHYGEEHWSAKTTTIVTNGPFVPKGIEYGDLLRLDRNAYYYINQDKNEAPDKYVIPYRLVTEYERGDSEDMLAAFDAGEIFYDGELPLSVRKDYTKKATVTDMMASHSYMFNTENKLFSDARVRRALSMALDREAIADIVVFADAATGFIPNKVFDTKIGSSFRKTGGELLSKSADTDAAKALLKEAGVTRGSFEITVRDNEVDLAVAEYVQGVWEDLGFDVDIRELSTSRYKGDSMIVVDDFENAYDSGDFDVIAYDMIMLAPDAFSALAPFALSFSGNGVDMASDTYPLYGHVCGYNSDEYNGLIEEIYSETDKAKKYELLHKAEEMLLDDMPVIPLVFLKDAYISNNGVLSGIGTTFYGVRDFKGMKQKNYMSYKEVEEE